jgi:4-hydroxy-tetrahydrodipicolinate reductase
MKIALIGYGKMGKTIEELALQRGHEIVARITRSNTITALDFQDVDVAIEFTAPHFAVQHIEKCIENDTPVVVGTTAWNDHLDYIKDLVSAKNGTLLYASNFSVGVNIFFDINRRLGKTNDGVRCV